MALVMTLLPPQHSPRPQNPAVSFTGPDRGGDTTPVPPQLKDKYAAENFAREVRNGVKKPGSAHPPDNR
jgi:hypothetical protein